jgi:predicted CXXCH cytochrome family protein
MVSTGRIHLRYTIVVISVLAIIILNIDVAVAVDPPHNEIENINCLTCHTPHKYLGPKLITDYSINNLCKSCHNDAGPGSNAETHEYEDGVNTIAIRCSVCHNPHLQDQYNTHGTPYGKLIRTQIETPNSGVKDVRFTGTNVPQDEEFRFITESPPPYDGVCEVCHTRTTHHRNNDDNPDEADRLHGADQNCIDCHKHVSGLRHGGGAGNGCDECHGHDDGWGGGTYSGTTVSHSTHTENDADDLRGPNIACGHCHDTTNYPYFADGEDLSHTTVCNPCHSPYGTYDGVGSPVIGAKPNWDQGVYDVGSLKPGREQWCVGCHDESPAIIDGVSAPDVSLFWTSGHGASASVECFECHDTTITHIDGSQRTYAFDSAYYDPGQSGLAYQAGYRLHSVNGQVPLMIPCNYNITFGYNAALMRDNAFRLCFQCHTKDKIFDTTPGDGITSNFKASAPNPPRNYSYAWGSGADTNEHVSHTLNYTGPFADSDWDASTTGAGGSDGRDTLTACFACHNVHGADGTMGSTNEAMIRDGILSGRTGYGFSYVIEDTGAGGYPWVTSTGAKQANSVGAIFRKNTANMCGGSMCHNDPAPPSGSSYDATGSAWGTYLEYYRPYADYGQ